MTQKEKEDFVKNWFSNDKRKEVSEILDTIDTSVKKVKHSKEISEEDLFGDIDVAIKLLQDLKDSGYTSIEQKWHSYEDNGFYAHKIELENREEHERRLFKEVNDIYCKRKQEERRKEEIKKQIASREKELDELKRKLNINDFM